MVKVYGAAALLAVAVAGPVSAKEVNKFLTPSCTTMMAGWEKTSALDATANVTTTFKNASKEPVQVISRKPNGDFWQVIALAPGASSPVARMNSAVKLAWARQVGGRLQCVRTFGITNKGTATYS